MDRASFPPGRRLCRRVSGRSLSLAVMGLCAIAAVVAAPGRAASAADNAPAPAAVDLGTLEIVESKGTYRSQGKPIVIERFEPKAAGKYPAVLVIHGAGGPTIGGHWFRDAARMLARQGYVVHVVHYFDLTGTMIADLPTMKANFAIWLRALADGVTNVTTQPNVDPDRVGMLGFSLGSYLSVALSMFDARILAVVENFGGLPEPLVIGVKTLPPILILHGDSDPIVPVSQAKELETLCKAKKVPYEMCIYPGQGHGFVGDSNRDAARRTLGFFETHVKGAGAITKRETALVESFQLLAAPAEKADKEPKADAGK